MSASKSKNIADGLCGDFASGSARNPHPSAFDFPSLGGSVLERACAWLGERSEPTCIKTSTRPVVTRDSDFYLANTEWILFEI